MTTKWSPTEKPYRVRTLYRCGARGMSGWSDSTETFATLDQALEVMARPLSQRALEVQLDFAKNAASWGTDGKWVSLATRKKSKSIKYTKHYKGHCNDLEV